MKISFTTGVRLVGRPAAELDPRYERDAMVAPGLEPAEEARARTLVLRMVLRGVDQRRDASLGVVR